MMTALTALYTVTFIITTTIVIDILDSVL